MKEINELETVFRSWMLLVHTKLIACECCVHALPVNWRWTQDDRCELRKINAHTKSIAGMTMIECSNRCSVKQKNLTDYLGIKHVYRCDIENQNFIAKFVIDHEPPQTRCYPRCCTELPAVVSDGLCRLAVHPHCQVFPAFLRSGVVFVAWTRFLYQETQTDSHPRWSWRGPIRTRTPGEFEIATSGYDRCRHRQLQCRGFIHRSLLHMLDN